jgi:nickel-dependent lactate racemase
MGSFSIPYGQTTVEFHCPDRFTVEVVEPAASSAAEDPLAVVTASLKYTHGGVSLEDFRPAQSVAIAISDKTRPVPNHQLLPPLLHQLTDLEFSPNDIHFFIATGLHTPMGVDEYSSILPEEILNRYPVHCHDADLRDQLDYLGETVRGTPVWVNQRYAEADLRLVVGNIEPHQIQGFSGGSKAAAIGLAGRETINKNHSLMKDPEARVGSYDTNPARQDVEEIGRMIGIHFGLNAILNSEKQLVKVLAGEPIALMQAGILLCLSQASVPVSAPFDVAIASAGGYPKDRNLYQSQKALSHASLVVKDGGTIILVAACPEGTGSSAYEAWMKDMRSHEQVITRFRHEGFQVGPHKALQIAHDASRVNVKLVSQIEPEIVRRLLLPPFTDVQQAIDSTLDALSDKARIGIFPNAPSTIPLLDSAT